MRFSDIVGKNLMYKMYNVTTSKVPAKCRVSHKATVVNFSNLKYTVF